MVLIDYEDATALRDMRGPPAPYEYSTRVGNLIFDCFVKE